MSSVIVIGGGAAGMMAAYAAAECGHKVVLLEQNEKLGKKLYITGKGRCNVTNACGQDKLFENIVSNPKFLYSAFYDFDNKRMMELLERAGCPLKIERGERVFPVSDHSSDGRAATLRCSGTCNRGIILSDHGGDRRRIPHGEDAGAYRERMCAGAGADEDSGTLVQRFAGIIP